MQISGPLPGGEFSIELAGPRLGQLLEDAVEALVTLGIDVSDEPNAARRHVHSRQRGRPRFVSRLVRLDGKSMPSPSHDSRRTSTLPRPWRPPEVTGISVAKTDAEGG